ncbi:MAG TPA: hypothetical protein PK514_05545 [Spirochaetota bacterium]|nr:hypothetical protein [Spirochaetota bacterium]
MSFVILLFIFGMIYISLKKYSSMISAASTILLLFGLTTAFFLYGLSMLSEGETFIVVNTRINALAFYHFCVTWYVADLFCTYRVLRLYREYVKINSR